MNIEVFSSDVFTENYEIVPGKTIVISLTEDEVARLLEGFDETSSTSPSAALSREMAKPIAKALKEA